MKIAFNPSTVAALTTPPNNKDITFDLRGRSIFAQEVEFKGTDTNTWRDIKINNVSIGSYTLDLRNGSNTTLTNTNGVVTINSTWRPVVDNLTSYSTTSSLSAKQGKVLKALIDGKSNSDHNHDDRYVRYYAVTTLDCNNLAVGLTAARMSATNAAHTNSSAYLYISDVGTPFQIQIPDAGMPYIYKRYYESGEWSKWFKLDAGYADSAGSVAWANVTGKPSSYTPSAHIHDDRYYTKAQSNAKYITNITTSANKLIFTRDGTNIIRDIISGNASTATKLQTARSIWGQSFDGTRDVSGTLSGVANIWFSVDGVYDIGSNSATSRYIYTRWLGAKSGSKLELGANDSGYGKGLCIDTNLNVGIGTNTPAYKLDVNGQMRASGFHHASVNSDNYMLLAGGGYKSFGGDYSTPIFLGCLNLYHGGDGTISSSFYCLGYSVPFTYTRGGNYCKIVIPDTTHLAFYITAAIASVNYSGGGMDTWTGHHRGTGAWWLHCYASGWNEVRVQGFYQANGHNDGWWGGNPLWSNNDGANIITVCIFGHASYR